VGPVLLLDVAAVVLVALPAAGEGDPLLLAVGEQVVIDELRAVVRVDAEQGEGQDPAHVVDGLFDPDGRACCTKSRGSA
jgi:hypothetical protein